MCGCVEKLQNRSVFTLGNVKHLVQIVDLGRGKDQSQDLSGSKNQKQAKLKQQRSGNPFDLDVIMPPATWDSLAILCANKCKFIHNGGVSMD